MKKIALGGKQGQGKFALVDDEDYPLVSGTNWCMSSNGYVVSRRKGSHPGDGLPTLVLLHRVVLGVPKGVLVDHENHNRLDNQRNNLRACSYSENGMNRGKAPNNKSGYKGVSFEKWSGRWSVSIKVDGKHHHVGRFTDVKEAALAYNEASVRHFGRFAYLNDL